MDSRRLVGLVLAGSLVLATCSVPETDEPRTTSTTSPTATTSTEPPSSTTVDAEEPPDELGLLPTVELAVQYGGTGFDYATALAETGSGDIVMAADYRSPDSIGGDIAILSYTPEGEVRWAKLLGGDDEDGPFRNSIAVAPDGTSFVGAASYDPSADGRDMLLFSLDPNGGLRWQLAAPDMPGEQRLHAVVLDLDDHLYAAGHDSIGAEREGHSHRLPLIRLSLGGGVDWQRALSGAYAIDATLDADGNVIVSGVTDEGPDALVAKFSPNDGSLIWQRVWGSEPDPERATDVVSDPAGNIYVSGPVVGVGNGGDAAFILKLDADGGLLWARIYRIPGNEIWAHGAAFHEEGMLIVSGFVRSVPTGGVNLRDSGFLVAVSSEGELLWQAAVGSPGKESIEAIAANTGLLAVGQGDGRELSVAHLVVRR